MPKKENIYSGRIINLFREIVKLPNGRTRSFEIIRHEGSVAIVPMISPDKVVLIRQYRPAAGGFIWEIPAGTLEKGETPLACARRETIEEIGFRARHMKKLVSFLLAPGYCNEVLHLFKATSLKPAEQKLDLDECLEAKIFKLNTAIEMIYTGKIMDAKTIIGLFLIRYGKES